MTATPRGALATLAFVAAVLFFAVAAFGSSLGSVDLIPAGLTSLAAGLLIVYLPGL